MSSRWVAVRGGVAAVATLVMLVPAAAGQDTAASRTPDVHYVPTPHHVVEAMLRLTAVGPKDVVYDLGSGDGRIPIAAAKRFGARGVGIDIDPARIKEANANAQAQGVTGRVRFLRQDLFQTDFSDGDGGHALSAAVAQRQAPAHALPRAQARHPDRVARVRHGRLAPRRQAGDRGHQRLLLDHPGGRARRLGLADEDRRTGPSGTRSPSSSGSRRRQARGRARTRRCRCPPCGSSATASCSASRVRARSSGSRRGSRATGWRGRSSGTGCRLGRSPRAG